MNRPNPMLDPRLRCAMPLLLVALLGCEFETGALPDASVDPEMSSTTGGSTSGGPGTSSVTTMLPGSTGGADRDDSTTTVGATDSTGDVPPPQPGPCCEEADTAGCDIPSVEACVCVEDPYCCEQRWDGICVEEVSTLGCGDCPATMPDPAAPCCGPRDGPGCGDPMLEGCVCKADAYCCQVAWDDACADQVDALGCGECLGPGTLGATCCAAHPEPGCPDVAIESCVCAIDPFCCTTAWDEICVAEVVELDCGSCEPRTNGDDADCCAPHGTPGCDDATLEACVCGADPFCCQVAWDALCVEAAEGTCGGCNAGAGSTTTGSSGTGTTGGPATGGSTTGA